SVTAEFDCYKVCNDRVRLLQGLAVCVPVHTAHTGRYKAVQKTLVHTAWYRYCTSTDNLSVHRVCNTVSFRSVHSVHTGPIEDRYAWYKGYESTFSQLLVIDCLARHPTSGWLSTQGRDRSPELNEWTHL
ncbi:hypothetical protein B296_00045043, partial [Ensete ventricosum]